MSESRRHLWFGPLSGHLFAIEQGDLHNVRVSLGNLFGQGSSLSVAIYLRVSMRTGVSVSKEVHYGDLCCEVVGSVDNCKAGARSFEMQATCGRRSGIDLTPWLFKICGYGHLRRCGLATRGEPPLYFIYSYLFILGSSLHFILLVQLFL